MTDERNKSGVRKPSLGQKDFTGGGIMALSGHRGSTGDPEMDKRIAALVKEWGAAHPELIEELIVTALKTARDDPSVADLKLMNRSLKEIRAANRVFAPYDDRRKVVVFGSARTAPGQPEYEAAVEFGRKMGERGFMTITGGGDGIMGAAQEGAGRDNGFGLNIRLPFEQGANETIEGDHKLVNFNYFFTRKLTFLKQGHAVALFPGGFGTMDEGFEALTLMQTGKASIFPVVAVDARGGSYWKTWKRFIEEHLLRLGLVSPEDFSLFKVTDDVDEAVETITGFYRVFHSYRYVGRRLVLRLCNPLTPASVAALNEEFANLLKSGKFVQRGALKEESGEPGIAGLPRLVFTPVGNQYGEIRRLIDRINESETHRQARP